MDQSTPLLIGLFDSKATIIVLAILTVLIAELLGRARHKHYHYVLAAVVGTLISMGILMAAEYLLADGLAGSSALIGLGVVCVFLLWRLMFGLGEPHVKATVLGAFVLWVGLHILWTESLPERIAHALAIVVAIIPALVWSALFLKYHRERRSRVLLMFFAGMVSTAPILFYDALLRKGAELQFFFFRITPENFNMTINAAVHNAYPELSIVPATMLTLACTFILVGILEEISKYWVVRMSGYEIFSSIDDVLQLSVIVAIGFAFAENVLNQSYFLGFVNDYLYSPHNQDWFGFIGNVAGRSVLTSMVHIVSTGTMGYFFGLSLFAVPYLQEAEQQGKKYWLVEILHKVLRIPRKEIFRRQMLWIGLTIAVCMHALANFLVSLPDSLPGNPKTFGDLLGAPPGSPLHFIALLLFPSLLYVAGGFSLLSYLFTRRENMKERGHIFTTDTFVIQEVNA